MSGFVSLELQIISINVISLFVSIRSWFKWDQQLEKISNLSVSDELDVRYIDWLKTVLSWIVVVRSVIDRALLLAYIVNFYTIAMRKWQNLLIFWMVLSLLKDIVLEVIVVIVTFLQWHKGSVSTLLFLEFVAEKTIWLAISSCKWWTILKWYVRLRREAKVRRFSRIVSVPGRIGHSLDDECLDIATVRRGKYASLLNLNKLSKKSSNKFNFDLRISKSLETTSITNDDSYDSNDTNDSSVNDLSVAEKSMKMLGITAEDIMDACARIQERSYWSEQDVTTAKAMEEVITQFSLEKIQEMDDALENEQKDNVEKTEDHTLERKNVARDFQIEDNGRRKVNDPLRSKQMTIDVEKAVDSDLMKEVIQNSQIEREGEEDDNKIVSIDKKEQILIDKKRDVLLTKGGDVTPDRINNSVKSTEFHKLQRNASSRQEKTKEEAKRPARIEHYPLSSIQCKNARNMEPKPCASLVRKLKAKFRPISTNQKDRWLDQLDRKKYPYRIKLTPTGSDANKNENSRTSLCACHRALRRNNDVSRNDKYARSIDMNDKDIKHDIDRKEFRGVVSIVNARKDKTNGCGSSFKYLETYRLRKQIQKSEGSSTRQTITWGSMSLAQTARPSGYTRDVIAINKPSRICQRNVQTEAYDESSDSLNERYRSEWRIRSRSRQSEKNYARSEKREIKTSEAYNDLTLLSNKRGMKARRRRDMSPNRKLSSEERKAVELNTLRAFNELTLLEDKKKLNARKNRDSSLNYEQLTRESEVSEMKVYKSYNDLTLLEKQVEMDATREDNLSRLTEESSALNEYKGDPRIKEKYKTPGRYEEDVQTSTSVPNHLPEVNREQTGTPWSETHRNASSNPELNERYAGQAYMSLNLREITRNIEWTLHPRGVILTNKNLHRQFLENARFHDNQQRDIVDDNVASTLHSAFFFKPEVVTRIFRRAQARIGESPPSFPTSWREDFNADFVCQVNNETVVLWDQDSSFDRITDRSNFGTSSFPDADGNRAAGEDNRDLCIIFIDQEQASQESETAIIEDSTLVGSRQDTRSSVENIEVANILLLCILRDFGIEVSEESEVTSSAEQTEEYGDVSNIIVNDVDLQSSNIGANDASPKEEDDAISSRRQILHPDDDRLDDVDITSSFNLPQRDDSCNLLDKKYISAIDMSRKKVMCGNNSSLKDADNNATSRLSNSRDNSQFDALVDKHEERIPENASKKWSLFEDNINRSMLKSSDEEELQRSTQLSESEATLDNQKGESAINLETTNYDAISQFENVDILNLLETTTRDDATGNEDEDRNIYDKGNIFSTHLSFRMNQDERLQQDDSFYSMYERNNDSAETPVSLGDSSLMEEFSNNTFPPGTSSNVSINSTHSQ